MMNIRKKSSGLVFKFGFSAVNNKGKLEVSHLLFSGGSSVFINPAGGQLLIYFGCYFGGKQFY